eukprot:1160277-Pelagomonas_calceolata.AAC.11
MKKLEVGRCMPPFCGQAQECTRVEFSAWVHGEAGGGAVQAPAQECMRVDLSAWAHEEAGGGAVHAPILWTGTRVHEG